MEGAWLYVFTAITTVKYVFLRVRTFLDLAFSLGKENFPNRITVVVCIFLTSSLYLNGAADFFMSQPRFCF